MFLDNAYPDCTDSKLVVLFVIIAATVIVLGLWGIVSVVCSCPLKGFQAMHVIPDESYYITPLTVLLPSIVAEKA